MREWEHAFHRPCTKVRRQHFGSQCSPPRVFLVSVTELLSFRVPSWHMSLCLCLPTHCNSSWGCRGTHGIQLFMWVPGIDLGPLGFHGKHFYLPHHLSPAPCFAFWDRVSYIAQDGFELLPPLPKYSAYGQMSPYSAKQLFFFSVSQRINSALHTESKKEINLLSSFKKDQG